MAGRLSDERMREQDRYAVRLARSNVRLRLRIGEALDAMLGSSLHQRELGFSSVEGYAREECGRSGRWVVESRTVARRLSALPLVRAALWDGRLGWAMAELLARHATPETEAALLDRALSSTLRALRAELRAAKNAQKTDGTNTDTREVKPGTDADGSEDNEDDDPLVDFYFTAPKEDALCFEMTNYVVDHIAGTRTDDARMDVLASEGLTTMICAGVDPDTLAQDVAEKCAGRREERARQQAAREAAEVKAESVVHAQPDPDPGEAPEEPLPDDPYELAARIRQWCGQLDSRDLFLGKVCESLARQRVWQRLGYASEGQYARERLGISRSSMCARIALARRTSGLFAISRALSEGQLGVEAAQLIARVSTRATEELWVARAKRRTFKHLQEEVQAVEMLARVSGDRDVLVPPSEQELDQIFEFERNALTGALVRQVLQQNGYAQAARAEDTQMSAALQGTGVAAAFQGIGVAAATAANGNGVQMPAHVEAAAGDDTLAATSGIQMPAYPAASHDAIANNSAIQMPAYGAYGRTATGPAHLEAAADGDTLAAQLANQVTAYATSGPHQPVTNSRIDTDATDEDLEDLMQLPDTPDDYTLRKLGNVTYRLRVRDSVAEELRKLQATHRRAGLPDRFMRYLCLTFLQTWVPHLGKPLTWGNVIAHARFRCSSPVCFRRDCQGHHIKFRSHGGGDEEENITPPCSCCHLQNIHEYGSLRVYGPSSNAAWVFGRTPFMKVHGREKT